MENIIAPEVRLYLAAFIYRGMLYKPNEHIYHCKNKLFEAPGFQRIISQNELVLLERFLHFVGDEELGDSYNKAARIQPILDKLVEQFNFLLELERNISQPQLETVHSQKRSRFALKAFVFIEGSIGYFLNIILYTGGV